MPTATPTAAKKAKGPSSAKGKKLASVPTAATAIASAAPSKGTKGTKGVKATAVVEDRSDDEDGDVLEDASDLELGSEDEFEYEDYSDEDGDEQDDDEDEEEDDDDDDEDHDDVTEEGLERLMKALGDDGLDESDLAALAALRGKALGMEGDEDEEEEEEEGEEEEDDEEEEENDDEDDDEEEDDQDEGEDSEEEEDEEDEAVIIDPSAASSSKDTLAASLLRSGLVAQEDDDDDDEEEDEEEEEEEEDADASAIPLDSLTDNAYASLPDASRSSRFQREKINNKAALVAIRDAIALDGPSGASYSATASSSSSSLKGKQKKMDWIEHMSLTWPKNASEELTTAGGDASDDLKRELVFYQQALSSAVLGRTQVLASGMPFSRPSDFFAEMVKSDSHMERIRQTLLDERAGIKASEEAKRQRELKKFGKKVQVEKQLERQRGKKEMEEKIKGFKRKRGNLDDAGASGSGAAGGDDDDFDIRLESALENGSDRRSAASSGRNGRPQGGAKARMPRTARDAKFGFGGKKRFSKSNTRESTEGGTGKWTGPPKKGSRPGGAGGGKKGGANKGKRLGKSKRAKH